MIPHWSETLDGECDAPPYPIVRACRTLGVLTPEDVRWCRVDNAPPAQSRPWTGLFGRAFHTLFRRTGSPNAGCSCRGRLPDLELFAFTMVGGRTTHLLVGQCQRCRTIFWREPCHANFRKEP